MDKRTNGQMDRWTEGPRDAAAPPPPPPPPPFPPPPPGLDKFLRAILPFVDVLIVLGALSAESAHTRHARSVHSQSLGDEGLETGQFTRP